MEERLLQYYLVVAQEESITKAAEKLHITQPALSRRLTQLEEDVGTVLFTRGSKKTVLTTAGILFRQRAEEILRLMNKTREDVSYKERDLQGTVSIGAGDLEAVEIVLKLCAEFRKIHPKVVFDLWTGPADRSQELMDRGLLDIGVMLEPIDTGRYGFIRLHGFEQWCVMMRPDSPLAGLDRVRPEDLQGVPLILPGRENIRSELANWMGEDFGRMRITAVSRLTSNAVRMVHSGLGCALVIESHSDLLRKDRIVVRPLEPDLRASSMIVWRKYSLFGEAAQKFIRYMQDVLAVEDPGKLRRQL